jgi:hypothetical protein
MIPDGLAPSAAMFAGSLDARPRRGSVLAGDGTPSIPSAPPRRIRSRDRSKPLAAVGVMRNDPASRELVLKPAQGGYAALLWREGHRALMEAGANGRCDPSVYAQDARRNRLVHGLPADDGSSRFRFPRGDPAYRQLVSTPFLSVLLWSTVRRVGS